MYVWMYDGVLMTEGRGREWCSIAQVCDLFKF